MNRIALLMGAFHEKEMALMRDSARSEAQVQGLTIVREVFVPGAMEYPLAMRWLLKRDDIEGAAVLGIIERGETKHGLVMAQCVLAELMRLQQEFDKPVGVGILGPEIHPSQIPSRLDGYARAAISATKRLIDLKTSSGEA